MKIAAAVVAATLAVAPAPAQESKGAEPTPRLATELRAMAYLFDNLFQAPRGEPSEEVQALQVEGRADWRLRPNGQILLRGQASYTDYDSGFDASTAAGVGLRSEARPAAFEVLAEYLQNRPSLDVGDVLDEADVLRFTGEVSYRLPVDFQVALLTEAERQRYQSGARRDNEFVGAGGAVRYRRWGYAFLPEVGALWGERDADETTESHDLREAWIKVSTVPVPPLYLSARYRWREREYTTGDAGASNFGREDDRRQWSLTASLKTGERLTWNAYLADEDADSTRRERAFDSAIYGFGAAWRF